MIPYYNKDKIASCLKIEALIDAMEQALIAFSSGNVIQPMRMRVVDPVAGGDVCIMPAVTDLFAIKLVGNYPGNHQRGIDSHNGVIIVLDRWTGLPRALLDGTYITQMRTAAVSAVAARHLATADAKILAILGTGTQARGHYETMRRVRDFDEVRVWGRSREKASQFALEIGAKLCETSEEAVTDADVIATTTSAHEPILFGQWLKPGAHVSSVGWNGLDGRELDDEAMKNIILVESREAAGRESGNILVSGAPIHAELGEVLTGKVEVDPAQTTIFISVGIATEDAYAAGLILSSIEGTG